MKLKNNFRVLLLPLLAVFGLGSFFIPVENLRIRIFSHLRINGVKAVIARSTYKMLADGNIVTDCRAGDTYSFNLKGDSIEVRKNTASLGLYKYIKLFCDSNGELRIGLSDPERKARLYQDNMSFGVSDGNIRILNEVGLDNYIAGVTESEAGSKSSPEFYKVQAILARTFALSHINKHVIEGFSLCDQVHCQAYYGKPRDLAVYRAVNDTRGKVVVDDNLNLITAAFHSNSGGQTANSEDVWGSHTPYLRSIEDSFSVKMPNAKWERRMLKDDWLSYLKLKHNFPVDKEEGKQAAINFSQETRKVFLECDNSRVPLKNVRQDLQLKSTFFNIRPISGDSILFTGKGYGHGLGMCQEGAMRMVKLGYSYTQVLNFYYQNIQLIDLRKLNFFKDE